MPEFNILLRAVILVLFVIWMIHLATIEYQQFGNNRASFTELLAIVVKMVFSVTLITAIVVQ